MEALGYVELRGLSSATVAADRMLKTSDVKLSRIENAKNGWITLEFKGDIAALKVAVETVKRTLPHVYIAGLVIGSPSAGLNKLGNSGPTDVAPRIFNPEKYKVDGSIKSWAVFGSKPPIKEKKISNKNAGNIEKITSENNQKENTRKEDHLKKAVEKDKRKISGKKNREKGTVTCNLCGDPKCPRKLGEPHVKCIHYDELKNKSKKKK